MADSLNDVLCAARKLVEHRTAEMLAKALEPGLLNENWKDLCNARIAWQDAVKELIAVNAMIESHERRKNELETGIRK
jgi:hypothetical protein